MYKVLCRAVCLLMFPFFLGAQEGRILHVDQKSTVIPHRADGLSWETAYSDIHLALAKADVNDQIWVASGVYPVARPGDTNASGRRFEVPGGVSLIGAFPNQEEIGGDNRLRSSPLDVDFIRYPTILSAFIGEEGSTLETQGILMAHNGGETKIQGFIFRGSRHGDSTPSTRSGQLKLLAGANVQVSHSKFVDAYGGFVSGAINTQQQTTLKVYFCIFRGNDVQQSGSYDGTHAFHITAFACRSFSLVNSICYGGNTLLTRGFAPSVSIAHRFARSNSVPQRIINCILNNPKGAPVLYHFADANAFADYSRRNNIIKNTVLSSPPTSSHFGSDIPMTSVNVHGPRRLPVNLEDHRLEATHKDFMRAEDLSFVLDAGDPSVYDEIPTFKIDFSGEELSKRSFPIGPYGYSRPIRLRVTRYNPSVVFPEVENSIIIEGTGFDQEFPHTNRVVFLGGPGTNDDVLAFGSPQTSERQLWVSLPGGIATGPVKITTGNETIQGPELIVRKFDITTFPREGYSGEKLEIRGLFSNQKKRMRVVFPGDKEVPIEELRDHSYMSFRVPTQEVDPGPIRVFFDDIEKVMPTNFSYLIPEIERVPTNSIPRGATATIHVKGLKTRERILSRYKFWFERGGVVNPIRIDPTMGTAEVVIPEDAVTGLIGFKAYDNPYVFSKTRLIVEGAPAVDYAITRFPEEAFEQEFITIFGNFSSFGQAAVNFDSGGGGRISAARVIVQPDQPNTTWRALVPEGAATGKISIREFANESVDGWIESESEITILPPLTISAVSGGGIGDIMRVVGQGFSKYKENNVVTIGGIRAEVTELEADGFGLSVKIPDGVSSNHLQVQVFSRIASTFFGANIVQIRDIIGNPAFNQDSNIGVVGTGFSPLPENEVTFLGNKDTDTDDVVVTGLRSRARGSSGLLALIFPIPENAPPGYIKVRVGKSASVSKEKFYYFQFGEEYPLVITGFSPSSVQELGPLTIRGIGFGILAQHNEVSFTGHLGELVEGTVLGSGTNFLRVKVPIGAATGPVLVKVGGKTTISGDEVTIVSLQEYYRAYANQADPQKTNSWIYPNPLPREEDELHISIPYQELTIYDVSAREILRSKTEKNLPADPRLNLSGIASGIYWVEVLSPQGSYHRARLLKL
ncbi:MAG: T9SS type A sorting domain-containing protein [Cytophagales bacterium]|nr:T9SS type A sorting domain-containing protein [Cytophagales bacterium]